jgi:hypothetical protein
MFGGLEYCAQPHNQGIPYSRIDHFCCFAANANRLLKQPPVDFARGPEWVQGVVAMRRFLLVQLWMDGKMPQD